jgi:signal peptidase I
MNIKILLVFIVFLNMSYSKDIFINNYDDLIKATNNLTKPIDQRWIFVDENNKIVFENDPKLKEYFGKYFYFMLDNNIEIQAKNIPTKAMQNTIYQNETVFLFKGLNTIFRGGVFAFYDPNDKKTIYAKRCVATGGDILFLKDKSLYLHPIEGNQYVTEQYKDYEVENIGTKLFIKDPYKKVHQGIHHDKNIAKDKNLPIQLFDMDQITIPSNECFMMGDNREHSIDSRFFGSVNQELIIGVIIPIKFKRLNK